MKQTSRLRRAVLARRASVVVLGQGYVGLTVACAAAESGFPVTGIDIDGRRIDDLRAGTLSVPGVADTVFRPAVASGRLAFTTDADAIAGADVVLVCVPTPLRDDAPDLSHVERGCRDVAGRLGAGCLVILESTTYPGTTDELVRPILEASGLTAGRDFLLAYSPERIDPGNDEFGLRNTPRVVGGHTPEATAMATVFYEQLVDKVVATSSARAAELAKLLENTFRHVNVALVNEMAMLCHEMGIDVWEVLEAAATKPFGFTPFAPGPGVGGHCIPLDPTYLSWRVRRDSGRHFRILEQAQDINAQMPAYVVARIGEALNERGVALNGASILALGVGYKPDIGDIRESPAVRVMSLLRRRGAKVTFHDPFVSEVVVAGDSWKRRQLTRRTLSSSDCVVLLTPHATYDLDWVADNARLIFDARGAFRVSPPTNVARL